MVSLSQIKTSNASLTGANLPQTIVMTGATGGIGAATLTLLAHKSAEANSPMRIYLLGRNGDRHAAFLDSLRNLNPSTLELVWIECQVSLLADIKRAALEITRKESHIDVLYVSAGVLPWSLNETDEGLDLSLALAYYSRMALVSHLLPLLKASTCANGPRVVDVLDTGNETANLPLDDIGLKKPGNRGPVYFVPVGATYTTVALDRLARRAGGEVVMIHNHPGIVHTDILAKGWGNGVLGRLGKAFMQYILVPFTRVVGFSAEESGERCLFLMTSAVYGGRGVPVAKGVQEGINAKGSKGTDIVWTVDQKFKTGQMAKVLKEVEDKGIGNKIWEHTMEVLNPYM